MTAPTHDLISDAQLSAVSDIGRLLKSSTREFVFACRVPEPQVPLFGSFVRAPAQQNQSDVIGLIYNIAIEDDQFVKQMVAGSDSMSDEQFESYVLDNRERRKVPIEVSVLSIGYCRNEVYVHDLPPQPPITLDKIYICADSEIRDFTNSFDYVRLVLDVPDVSVDELIAVSLRNASKTHMDSSRFLVNAGKELARLLNRDLVRLEKLLRRIKPSIL